MLRLIIKESGRLDRVLRKSEISGVEWLSRAAWDSIFDQGLVRSESGQRLAAGSQQDAGTVIQLQIAELRGILPASESLAPIWCSDDVALFDKPAGIDSYPLVPWETESFANRVARWMVDAGKMSAEDFSRLANPPLLEGGLTQRLDRDTSGALLVALTAPKKSLLRTAFSTHRMNKTYLALVNGSPKAAEVSLYTWPENPKKMAAASVAKKADAQKVSLKFTILAAGDGVSLVQVASRFGTRHVVRVIMSTIGHPLVGDALYGSATQTHATHLLHALSIRAEDGPEWPQVPPPKSFLDSCLQFGIHYSP